MVLIPYLPVDIPDETIDMRESVRKLIELDSENDEWSYDDDDGDFELETMETVY
jgi:hypothetical protein|tara:strand:+ start:4392 stop:4553 length:162 start_codon:yes stop_codon:yes gene_type:complete